jgi:threonine synthase
MYKPIRYISTNRQLTGGNRTPFTRDVSFREALLTGLAPDDGLFMPDRIPVISPEQIKVFSDMPYHEVARVIISEFLSGEVDKDIIRDVTRKAYTFAVPVEQVDSFRYIMRLDRGPTASFKDFAARFMARMMQRLKEPGSRLTILVATSGDTGSAVGHAFHGLDGIAVYILYPEQEVSPIQQKQLDSIGDNVRAVAVDGTFDDCQRMVKEAFLDSDLRSFNLTSANSINIGRILPQIPYYFYAFARICEENEPLVVSVPSGNFGNSLGCELARRMGLPVAKLILAVNANDEFPRFLETEQYSIVSPSIACISNAMNVGNPSNLARYFELYNGTIDKNGTVHQMPDIGLMRENLYSCSVSDKTTIDVIRDYYTRHSIILEPHGAVGIAALDRYFCEAGEQKALCLETAHPAKFMELMNQYITAEIPVPDVWQQLFSEPGYHDCIPNNYPSFKEYLKNHEMD